MSHVLTGLIDCPTLQNDLDSFFTSCDPTKTRELLPLTQFLLSGINTNNVLENTLAPGAGKRRKLQVVYTPRVRENEVADNVDGVICQSDNFAGMLSTEYEVNCDTNVSIDESFEPGALSTICKANSLWFAERMQAMIDGLMRKLESRITVDLAGLIGGFAAGETNVVGGVKTVQTKFANGFPDTNLLEEVTFAAMNAQYCGGPYGIGYGEFWKYFQRLKAGCCADSGLNLFEMLQQQGMAITPSYRIEQVFGVNHFITMAPGALQLLHFNLFEGMEGLNTITSGSHRRGIIRDPLTNLPIDILFNFPCDGNLTVQMKICFRLVGMPDDMFSIGDRLAGVTGVNHYRILNP